MQRTLTLPASHIRTWKWTRPVHWPRVTAAFAHTSPVYVQFGSERVRSAEDAKFYDDWIEKLIAATNERGRFTNVEHRKEVVNLFRKAQQVYKQLETK